jgi:adenine-specific DNA-methyltransferase
VQISDENVHHVRELMDEVFGVGNFVSLIAFKKGLGYSETFIPSVYDYLIVYAKEKEKLKYQKPYIYDDSENYMTFSWIELKNRERRRLNKLDFKDGKLVTEGQLFQTSTLMSKGSAKDPQDYEFEGQIYYPSSGAHWKTKCPDGLDNLKKQKRLIAVKETLAFVRFKEDFPYKIPVNVWDDTIQSTFSSDKIYVVQTNVQVISRCLLMTTDPGDLVLDPTCGSGTTAYVAEQWGRRWITCDTSRVAITLAKQRLMTALFDYYELAHPQEGVGSGFKYKTVPHITLKSIANNEPPAQETLYDQPFIDNSRTRVTGPFTVEAVPAPMVKSLDDVGADLRVCPPPLGEHIGSPLQPDESIARSGETLRQSEWRDELFKAGIRGKGGQKIEFSRVEPLPGTRYLHVDGETKGDKPQRVVVSFGPEHAPLEQRQVELAWEEARTLIPHPQLIVFAAFQFDPEAAKDIDELDPRKTGMTFLKAQMNADLLTEDLKKKRASNESFWLIGQPDVRLTRVEANGHPPKNKKPPQYRVEVLGFDYYNTRTGIIESGGTEKIAMWMLDTDYDGRSLFPRQVFFPMAGEKEGWSKLTRNLKAEIDEELIEAYRGTVSLPFEPGKNKRVAVKIVDDRGIESLKIMEIE